MDAGIDAHVTEPIYLVEVVDLDLHWTTSKQLTWNSIVWQAVGLRVLSVSESGARLQISNTDNVGSSLILNNQLRDTEFRIYLYYNGDAYERYRLYGSEAQINSLNVTIQLAQDTSRNTMAPRRRIAAPTFTKLPRLGEVIVWAGQSYKVTH